jgi:hypothetical protein
MVRVVWILNVGSVALLRLSSRFHRLDAWTAHYDFTFPAPDIPIAHLSLFTPRIHAMIHR